MWEDEYEMYICDTGALTEPNIVTMNHAQLKQKKKQSENVIELRKIKPLSL
jgi:hypothetical protein